MLRRLRITEYALIDEVEVEFGPGLNVLTGETGAGKSILVEGLGLLLGERAATDAIRTGADTATVEGVFEDDRGETLFGREIRRDASNRCAIDGRMATARMLQEEGETRVRIHGQHEGRHLVRRAVQRELLDAFAGAGDLAADVAARAEALAALEREGEALARAADERDRRLAYLRSQVEEIEAAAPEPGEDARLAAEAEALSHASERRAIAAAAGEALDEGDGAAAPALAAVERALRRLAALDAEAGAWAERLAAARYDVVEVARELAGYAERAEDDPGRLAAVEERRDRLFRLARKHGPTLDDVLERGRAMASERAGLEAEADRAGALDRERARLRAALEAAARALADARGAAADRLEAAVRGRLAALGMGDGTFEVEISRRAADDGIAYGDGRWAWTRGGMEEVAFLVAPNAGEPPRPIDRIASGGELSRVLLALEAALAAADHVPTLVFDEIDAGIGGVVAHDVARELAAVARHHQVIVVTHLAQIAAAADRHLVVEKATQGGRAVARVRAVEGDERIREVSRLLGGDPERDVSRHHAEALLGGR